jgi:hypothetical protein
MGPGGKKVKAKAGEGGRFHGEKLSFINWFDCTSKRYKVNENIERLAAFRCQSLGRG